MEQDRARETWGDELRGVQGFANLVRRNTLEKRERKRKLERD
jgi:hypothetical protein